MSLLEAPPLVGPLVGQEFTLDEWLLLPEDEDGIRTEVCDGELVMAASPNTEHQDTTFELTACLKSYLPRTLFRVYWDIDVILKTTPLTVRRPDVSVVIANPQRTRSDRLRASDIVLSVEILSPSNRRIDTVIKRGEYAKAGIPEYWIVDIDAPSLEVWRLGAGPSYNYVQTVTDRADLPLLGHTIPIDLAALTAL